MQLYADADSAFVTVEFEPQDVRSFARSWPCFHGPERVSFTFERATGDLVDVDPLEFDGPEAVAMSEDGWSYYQEETEPDPPETFRGWLLDTLEPDQLHELATHGADTGWPGLTYTADCVELYDRYRDDIRAALEEDAEALGYDCPDAFVASFGRSDLLWTEDGRRTLLVWYLAERIAREVTEAA